MHLIYGMMLLAKLDSFTDCTSFFSSGLTLLASNIIDNSGDLEDTKAQIVKILG